MTNQETNPNQDQKFTSDSERERKMEEASKWFSGGFRELMKEKDWFLEDKNPEPIPGGSERNNEITKEYTKNSIRFRIVFELISKARENNDYYAEKIAALALDVCERYQTYLEGLLDLETRYPDLYF